MEPSWSQSIATLSGPLLLFGFDRPHGTLQGLASIAEIIWEFGLGIYATVWGFEASSSILSRKAAAT
jgi:hypothetical protein